MFRCKACSEKDNRIQDLKSEIEYLRSLVIPTNTPTISELEADAVLSGRHHVINVDSEEVQEEPSKQEVASEAIRILTGNY